MPFHRKKRPADAKPLTPDEALQKLEQFCAFRERAPKEVRDRLAELGLDEATAQQLYDLLETEKFFNEERFAHSFVHGKFRINHWGRVRIRQELKMRDIDPALIREALDAIPEDEYRTMLRQLIERRRAEYARRGDENAREKIAAAMIRAGFEPDLVFGNL